MQAGLCSNTSCGLLKEALSQEVEILPEEDDMDKLCLFLEPEAAAFYCQSLSSPTSFAEYCKTRGPVESNNYLVVDVGGGTVDIAAYKTHHIPGYPEPCIELVSKPAGGLWGGVVVTKEFKNFMEQLTGDRGLTRYINTWSNNKNTKHKIHWEKIISEFETDKELFGNNRLEKNDMAAKISLHASFIKCYGVQLEERITEGEMYITYEQFKCFFDPVVKGIIDCVADALTEVSDVHLIYLVGGFGGCEYIYTALTDYFKDKHFVTPVEKEYSVVKGAAMMRKSPERIKARRADATYGVGVTIPFMKGLHNDEYCIHGKVNRCSNIFATFVKVGEAVSPKEVYQMTFYPERNDQTSMMLNIYSSEEDDVWYITGKRPFHDKEHDNWCDVQKIGELYVPFEKKDGKKPQSRAVIVTFDFSTAEIRVTGRQQNSTMNVKVVLDFLEV